MAEIDFAADLWNIEPGYTQVKRGCWKLDTVAAQGEVY
jgi:hypothetical protein